MSKVVQLNQMLLQQQQLSLLHNGDECQSASHVIINPIVGNLIFDKNNAPLIVNENGCCFSLWDS
jgi:hypothetical protein